MKMLKQLFSLFLFLMIEQCIGAKILALIPFPGKSHYINMQPIMQKLAERGHELTVVTTFYEKDPPENYRQIVIDKKTMWEAGGKTCDKFKIESMPFWREMIFLWDSIYFTTEVAFNSSSLQQLLQSEEQHFDLVIIELVYQEALFMIARKYNAPIVTISTFGFMQHLGANMGNPLELSYMPHEFLPNPGNLNPWIRLKNIYYTFYDLLGRYFYMLPRQQRLSERHFKDQIQPLPRIHDLEKNVSLVLINTHFSIDTVRPQVPGIIEIGGVHIKPQQLLPDDIEKFIKEAKYGVVYFSLGSNLNSKDMPKEKIQLFLSIFGKLKQRVLWKYEDENLPNKPDNVMIRSWLPQTDVLAHSNVVLFITHGGLLSFIEAVHFGKPMISLPIYGDQFLNAAKAQYLGIGIKLEFSSLTETQLSNAIHKTLHEQSYTARVTELSNRFRDRPMSPMATAIFWIEYVIRHKGAKFMRSPALDLTWYEQNIISVTIIAILSMSLIYVMFINKKHPNVSKQKQL